MRVCVIGGTGHIGKNLTAMLVEAGYDVTTAGTGHGTIAKMMSALPGKKFLVLKNGLPKSADNISQRVDASYVLDLAEKNGVDTRDFAIVILTDMPLDEVQTTELAEYNPKMSLTKPTPAHLVTCIRAIGMNLA